MASANFSQSVGLQFEKVRPELELLYQQDSTLWSRLEDKSETLETSGRATRLPLELLQGADFKQFSPDGDDMGIGGGITTDAAQITPVYFVSPISWSKQSEISTGTKEKAIVSFAERQLKQGRANFNTMMEAMLQGDGSGTLDVVVAASGSTLTVTNANQFVAGQTILTYTGVGGTKRGTLAVILGVDAGNKQLILTDTIANTIVGTVAGDLIVVKGSTATAGASLLGIKYHQVNANTGTWLGLNRATYPGVLSTPRVNASSTSLTPAMIRRTRAQVQIALGINAPQQLGLVYHMNLDQVAAWEDVHISAMSVQQQAVSGNESLDMLKKNAPSTMGGYEIIPSIHAAPGRIDGLCLKNWGKVVNQKVDFYEVGDQILFPQIGTSGGVQSNTIAYIWFGGNVFNANPRAGVFCDNLPVPTGY